MLRLRARPASVWLGGNQEIEETDNLVAWCTVLSCPFLELITSVLLHQSRISAMMQFVSANAGRTRTRRSTSATVNSVRTSTIELYITTTDRSLVYLMIQCMPALLFSFILSEQHGDNLSCLQCGKTLESLYLQRNIKQNYRRKSAELQRERKEIEHSQVPSSASCSWKKDCPELH